MTDKSGYRGNYRNSIDFRAFLVLLLQLSGIDAKAKPRFTRLSDSVLEDHQASDLWDINGWSVMTRREVTIGLSAGMNAAAEAAQYDGNTKFGCVWHRKDHAAGDSYVVMPFSVFAQVLREENERGGTDEAD